MKWLRQYFKQQCTVCGEYTAKIKNPVTLKPSWCEDCFDSKYRTACSQFSLWEIYEYKLARAYEKTKAVFTNFGLEDRFSREQFVVWLYTKHGKARQSVVQFLEVLNV